MKRKQIIINYLKTWFVLDFLASFPYSWVAPSGDSDGDDVDDVS